MAAKRAKHNRKWTKTDVKKVLNLTDQGIPNREIAKAMGRTPVAINTLKSNLKTGKLSVPKTVKRGRPKKSNSGEYLLATTVKRFGTLSELNAYIEEHGMEKGIAARKLKTTLRIVE